MNVQNFVLAAVMAAAFLSAWAGEVEEVEGGIPTAYPNACEYEKWKGKIVKAKNGKTHDCRYYHILELYGYQGSEGNVAYGMSEQALCSGTVYYCEYIGGGKFKKTPIKLTYSNGSCRSDNRLVGPRFNSYYGASYTYDRFKSVRLSHNCPGEVVPDKGNGDGDKPKPDDGNKPKPGDGDKPKPGDGDKPKPGDGDKPKPGDGDKPKPGDGDKPKPDDGDKPDNSNLENILKRLNDTIQTLNERIGGLGGSGGGRSGQGGGNGGGAGGSGKGDGGSGGKGDGNGKGDGKGNGEGVGSGEDMPGFSADNGDIKPREPFDLGGFSVTGYFTSSGSCPAPVVVDLGVFGRMQMTYDWLCRLAGLIRPVAIAFAWLSALMIIVKGSRRT